ncbi:hypothetical protein C4D60_Mb03t21980 [Musa balbisiana]|uniref:Uncharacterized protein n=1 Tax=Musa balbisiana TaxID=52838 RepID=A0A4S8JE46_MUSBA|nr:hypothetical protein C4D60_Mb03t21980 [Musa balbisiana]
MWRLGLRTFSRLDRLFPIWNALTSWRRTIFLDSKHRSDLESLILFVSWDIQKWKEATRAVRLVHWRQRKARFATFVTKAATESVNDGGRSSARVPWGRACALTRSTWRLVSSERPSGASLKRVAWPLNEAFGPRLTSPEHLCERPSTFLKSLRRTLANVGTPVMPASLGATVRLLLTSVAQSGFMETNISDRVMPYL